MKYSETSARFT